MARYKSKGLTDKQKLFVENYLQCWNATKAARASGYKEPHQSGFENLKSPEIQVEIQKRLNEVHMSTDEALAILAQHAHGDLGEFVNDDGLLTLAEARKKGLTHLIKSISKRQTKNGTEYRVELYSAQEAVDKVLRVHGKYIEKHEITGKDGKELPAPIIQIYIPENKRDDSNT